MHSPSRRRNLARATTVMLALPWVSRAMPDNATPQVPAQGCTFSVATLNRSLSTNPATKDDCLGPSGSSAVFQAASLSKPVVASLALKLALRGALDLDAPLSELLPGGYSHRQNLFSLRAAPIIDNVPVEILSKLTARQLLSHTSGLPNWADKGPLQLSFKPGARWQYSGEGFVLLQHLLQTLTGKSLQDFASTEVFLPLGLKHSALKITEQIAESLVPGRDASGAIRQLRFPYEIASSSLYTTAADYTRFLSSVLADEPLLSLITQDPVPLPRISGVFWGLGWGIERTTERTCIWHWGNNPGFRALVMADIKTRDAFVALSASETGMPLAKSRLMAALPGPHPALDLSLVQ
jgi:CubicO group peptidase (beta-lactamase class C family)